MSERKEFSVLLVSSLADISTFFKTTMTYLSAKGSHFQSEISTGEGTIKGSTETMVDNANSSFVISVYFFAESHYSNALHVGQSQCKRFRTERIVRN